jgi:hypothetical protein
MATHKCDRYVQRIMSQHRDREQSGRSIPTRPERVLDAFVDGAPRTVDDVAIAANVDTDVARATLEALVEDGTLTRRSVSGVDITERKAAEEADIDLDAEIDLWSLTPDELTEGQSDPATAEDRIDRRLERMTVPGASEMMQNWRRDAVRAAYERLDALDGDELTPAALRDDLFGTHEAGFDTPEAWWDFVRPRLYRLPGVTVEDGCWCVLSDGATDDPTAGPN